MGSNLILQDDDDFDWEAAVKAIDLACQETASGKPTASNSNFDCNLQKLARQSTLDKFIGVSSGNSKKPLVKVEFSNEFHQTNRDGDDIIDKNGDDVADCEYVEMHNGFVKIDPEAAKTWIYPVNIPLRDYQFSITKTALFSNTLVVLPTGLGKTLIAAVVMYNFFRWFPEGKIVFAAPSRALVLQQIEACHNIVGIPQEWTIDLTGGTNPKQRADLWRDRRVFFVTPQVLEKDIHSGSCLVKHLVCLVIDEAHRATGNYAYCVAVRELMDTPVQLRILALTATPGSKQEAIQNVIDNLHISTLEHRNESDPDVLPFVHDRKIELIEVAMGDEAVQIDQLLSDAARPFITRLSAFGVMSKRDFQTLSPCGVLDLREKFRQEHPQELPHPKYEEIEGYFGVLITMSHVRKLLSGHGIRPAFEMLDEKLKKWYFARLMSKNEFLLKAKLLMEQTLAHGAPSPKLAKLLEVLLDHFKVKDPKNSRVIIFSNFRGSVRDILDALTNIRELVKATEFIGQSSGKTSKGQSQKVQQAVLQKFRTGGYNVIVATSIGEEGLDIMEVDLVICFDANISPLRMIQRMGRTGRKHQGRVVVLACEGSELKGYMQKQAKGKAIKKHMRNGGINSFNFHPSPRMVPHVFRPKAQYLEMSIEKFVPRGKQVKDSDNPVAVPAYKNKLTDVESDLLAKYFASVEISWKPSLITFLQFQTFPSPVDKVVHSSRTGMLIDTMQFLQGLKFSKHSKSLSAEDKDILNPFSRAERMDPRDSLLEDSERSFDPGEEDLKKEFETDTKVEDVAEDIHVEDFREDVHRVHHDFENREEMSAQIKDNSSSYSRQIFLRSSPRNLDRQASDDEEIIFESPVSIRMLKEMDLSCEDDVIVDDFTDSELSPRLTNLIESGFVPESPVSGACEHDERTLEDGSSGRMDVPCPSDHVRDMKTHAPCKNPSSPSPVAKEKQTPLYKLSNTSCSEDGLLDSKAETVARKCKLRRLRKVGDLDKKVLEQTGPKEKLETSKGKKKRARHVAVYIEEEAEVSSESMESDNEEDDIIDSSYEDSFIDDGGNPTPVSTQSGSGRDMMAIYRRSLLSQSPFQRLPTKFSPDSVVQSSRIDESGGSSGPKHDETPQTGLQSTARISQMACDEKQRTLETRKRKLSDYQAQSVPKLNLYNEFSVLSETAEGVVKEAERRDENIDLFEDDQFFEGIDLDAIEEEATKLFRQKSECSNLKTTTLSDEPVQNFDVMDFPSFDLGI